MALEEYRAKRNFSKSPEPPPKVKKTQGSFFCVQKHLASHLHYDFRLEHNGVLLSWAIPKGPSLNPKDRRLAMHVEDHPVDYGTFEGVIPEGYGAGVVMLWDQGTWVPEVPDVDAALRKGDLKFTLNGYKLKGSWVLVRTRGGDGRSWLLIKHRDEWSGELEITEFAPQSVKSGGDFEDIVSAEKPAIWLSNRPARGGEAGAMFERILTKVFQTPSSGAPAEKPRRPTEPASRQVGRSPRRQIGTSARVAAPEPPKNMTPQRARPAAQRTSAHKRPRVTSRKRG
jgi:bifunctional non-homologous end joining protein LigD